VVTVFFSYSHKDEALRDQLEIHLAMLKRQGVISTWHDRRLAVGDDLDVGISRELEQADIVLLLVSADFLASEYCYGVEMSRAMERHKSGTARVIPVILRPCDWHQTPFGKLVACPADGRPVTKFPDPDDAFLEITKVLRAAAGTPVAHSGDRVAQLSPQGSTPTVGPRSSNLRIRKEFSDADRSRFLKNSFEFMARFFENSLEELKQRNSAIESDFTRVDAQQFTAAIYRRGNAQSQCRVRLNPSSRGFGSGITFSHDVSDYGNAFNESLSVEADEQSLFLRPMGMGSLTGTTRGAHLSDEGAAEFYWEMFIQRMQQ
jgi:hypothetical protein